jgi:hypothetical protein
METIKVQHWRNIGNTKFLQWLDYLHPQAGEIFWRSTCDLFWDVQTHPDYRNRYPELKPDDCDIAQEFEFWQKLIKSLMNIDAEIDWEDRELVFYVPADVYAKAWADLEFSNAEYRANAPAPDPEGSKRIREMLNKISDKDA